MVELNKISRIYFYSEVIDLRKGLQSLTNIIMTKYEKSEIENSLFVFYGKSRKQIKILEIMEDGVWLHQKYLNEGRFPTPSPDVNNMIGKEEFQKFINTIDESFRIRREKKNQV